MVDDVVHPAVEVFLDLDTRKDEKDRADIAGCLSEIVIKRQDGWTSPAMSQRFSSSRAS